MCLKSVSSVWRPSRAWNGKAQIADQPAMYFIPPIRRPFSKDPIWIGQVVGRASQIEQHCVVKGVFELHFIVFGQPKGIFLELHNFHQAPSLGYAFS